MAVEESSPKVAYYRVADEAPDLGAPRVTSGNRVRIVVLSGPWKEGDDVFTRDTKAFWKIVEDPPGTLCAEMVAEYGASASAFSNAIYVNALAPAGGDGSAARPFTLLSQALAVVTANTVILIAPGTYTENVVMPNVENVCIVGAGIGLTILQQSGDSDAFSWVRTGALAALAKFTMVDLTLRCTAATAARACLRLDANLETPIGPPGAAGFGTELFRFARVALDRSGVAAGVAAFLRRVGNLAVSGCTWAGAAGVQGLTTVTNCSNLDAVQSTFTRLDLEYLRANPQPSGDRGTYRLGVGTRVTYASAAAPTQQGVLTLRGHPVVVADPTVVCTGNATEAALLGVGLTSVAAGALGSACAPVLTLPCTFGAGVALSGSGRVSLPLPAFTGGQPAPVVDMSRAVFSVVGATAGHVTATAASGSSAVQNVNWQQARFSMVDASGAAVAGAVQLGSTTAGINGSIAFDARGAAWNAQTIFSAATNVGSLDRSTWLLGTFTLVLVATVTPINPPFPASVGASYQVGAEVDVLQICSITAKAATGFSRLSLGLGNVTFTLTRQ